MGAGVTPLHEWQVGHTRTPLLVLLAAVGLLLAIACANVANLLLSRAAGRRREIAVRAALGAGRARLARQAGRRKRGAGRARVLPRHPAGALGPAPCEVPGAGRSRGFRDDRPVRPSARLRRRGGRGLGPPLRLRSGPARPAVRLRRRPEGIRRRRRQLGNKVSGHLAGSLVVAEIALAMLLFSGAFLAARSFWRLTRVDPGFETRGRVAAGVLLTAYEKDEAVAAFQESLLEHVRALPGVRSAAIARELPLEDSLWTSDFSVRGRPPGEFGIEVTHNEVSSGYFRTMGTPILRGRDFRDADRANAEPVVLITESLARQYFANEDPIGRQLTFSRRPDADSDWHTIVGVVGDQRHDGLTSPAAPDLRPARAGPQPRARGGGRDDRLAGVAPRSPARGRPRSIPRSRSTNRGGSTTCATPRWAPTGSCSSCLACSAAAPCYSPSSASTASLRTTRGSAAGRSGSGSRSARADARSGGSSSPAGSAWARRSRHRRGGGPARRPRARPLLYGVTPAEPGPSPSSRLCSSEPPRSRARARAPGFPSRSRPGFEE